MDVLPVGMGAYVTAHEVVAIVPVDSAPVRWLVRRAEEAGRLIDATRGRRTRAIIRLANGDVLLSALQPETLASRLRAGDQRRSADLRRDRDDVATAPDRFLA